MNRKRKLWAGRSTTRALCSASLMLGLLASHAPAASQTPSAKETKVSRGEPVTLNFVNAPIEEAARTMALISGRNVVVDPKVKGTISLQNDRPTGAAAALDQFAAALRLQGFALVEASGLYKVVPEADAKLQSATVAAGNAPKSGNQIVTQIFRLQHESAANLVPVLRPLISPNNTINVNPGNNSLVVTDYADNLARIGQIIAAMDVNSASDVEIIPLKHAVASDLAPLLVRLTETTASTAAPAGQADTSVRTSIMAEPRSNAIIVRAANAARISLIRQLVEKLDLPNGQASGNIHVVYLKNADATKLAATLRAAMGATSSTPSATGAAPSAAANAASASTASTTGGQIQADVSTNALVITATEPQYRQLRAVIDKLDQRRAQVFVESLIAEVSADKAAEFGIQWQGSLGHNGNNNIGLLGTNFSIGGANIIDLATKGSSGNATPSTGLNFGVAHKTNGVYVLGFLARFLESQGDSNVLSTPNLLTLDNEEAKIVIGQNVPFVTGQYTNNNASSTTVNPFQTIERKDVGLTLKVKPQIAENGTIKMQVFQEISSVDKASVGSSTGLITNKRSIESQVLVEDGGIIVLGGLLEDNYGGNQEKVPGAGDIPILGNLFKSEARSRTRRNLMLFLRPVVVRDGSSSEQLSVSRYDLMRQAQQAAQPITSKAVPVNEAASLPAITSTTKAAPAANSK
jgi:general secretion pathway protein D